MMGTMNSTDTIAMKFKCVYAGYYVERATGWTVEKQHDSGMWMAATDLDTYTAPTKREAVEWLETQA